jgi:hypothetical protein
MMLFRYWVYIHRLFFFKLKVRCHSWHPILSDLWILIQSWYLEFFFVKRCQIKTQNVYSYISRYYFWWDIVLFWHYRNIIFGCTLISMTDQLVFSWALSCPPAGDIWWAICMEHRISINSLYRIAIHIESQYVSYRNQVIVIISYREVPGNSQPK